MIRSLRALLISASLLSLVPYSFSHSEEVDPDFIIDRPDYVPGLPWFKAAKSTWAFGLRVGMDGIPTASGNGNLFQLTGDWILPWQSLGLWSIGPQIAVLNLQPPVQGVVSDPVNLMAGFTARYQGRWFHFQPVVPTVALSWDYYRLKSTFPVAPWATGSSISFSAGLLFNLGWIDQNTAKEAFQSAGMTRAYLSAEIQKTPFKNQVFSSEATFYLFGLRFEFE